MKRTFATLVFLAAGLGTPAQAQFIKIPDIKIQTYQASASDIETVQVQRSAHTLTFAPFGGKNTVQVQCPQRAMQAKFISDLAESRLVWPSGGGLLFDYASKQLLMRNHFKNVELAPMQLRLSCDGSAPKLEAGAGLKLVETK